MLPNRKVPDEELPGNGKYVAQGVSSVRLKTSESPK